MFVCIGSTCGAGFEFVFYGKGVGVGRAVLKPGNGAIFAGCCRFRNNEPEYGANFARSAVVQLNPCAG